jgi:23S rRNA pseudouridine1911/1915/1917 synthase
MADETFPAPTTDRLDRLLAGRPSVGSRARARAAIDSGKVDVDGAICRNPSRVVPEGARVALAWNRPGTGREARKGSDGLRDAGVRILHADEDVVAIDKPPGLLTDTASLEQHRTQDSVYKRLRAWLRPKGDRPFTVHRIDRDTSGVVLFARNERAEANLREQFRARSPERVYRAIIVGRPLLSIETWRDHTRWNKGRLILEIVPETAPGALETISDVREVRQLGGLTEIEVRLTTGRRNQIRLQAAVRGLPIVGERLYVDRPTGPPAPRQLLHARRLGVIHPRTGAPLVVEAPLPPDWP